jgi:hypothetical protein
MEADMRIVIKIVLIGSLFILSFWCLSFWRHTEPALASHQRSEIDRQMIYNTLQRHDVLW